MNKKKLKNKKYIDLVIGKLLKSFNNVDVGQTGLFNKQVVPTSDSWSVLPLNSGGELNGHFSLKR